MTFARDTARAPMRHTVRIDKHFDGDTSHPPDDVFETSVWEETDGSIVTDPARIAELEAMVAPQAAAPVSDAPAAASSADWAEGDRVTVSGQDSEPFEGTIVRGPLTDAELTDQAIPESFWDQMRTAIVARDDGRTLGVPASYLSKKGD